jgi:hypothetical protein
MHVGSDIASGVVTNVGAAREERGPVVVELTGVVSAHTRVLE